MALSVTDSNHRHQPISWRIIHQQDGRLFMRVSGRKGHLPALAGDSARPLRLYVNYGPQL